MHVKRVAPSRFSHICTSLTIIMAPSRLLIILLMIQGVYSADDIWGVNYSPSNICALKDSSVIINCTYKYPSGHQIKKVFWTKIYSVDPPDLSEDSEYSERIQYLGDKQQDCSIRLTDVRHTDSHMYYFRFITDKDKWLGKPGVTLNVTDITDLQVESAETVTEGHLVTLTCKSRCSLADSATFLWIKNTQSLSDRTDKKIQLILRSVRREDAGNYSCAVQGPNHTSPAVYLNVMYPPKETLVVVHPSGEIVEGDSVTLTCISEANPPAEISWFKETHYIGSGSTYNISKINSDHSGEYKCKSSNEHGEKYSDTVTLNVLYPPKKVSASISGSGEIVEGDSVTLTCISESNPPVQNYTWFKESETSAVGSGQSFRALESGWFYCETQNEVGSQRSAAVSVTVKENVMIFYTVIGVLIFGAAVGIMVLVIWWMKKRNKSESQIVHHSPSHNSQKTCDAELCEVYKNVRTADDSCDDFPDYENVTTADDSCDDFPDYENVTTADDSCDDFPDYENVTASINKQTADDSCDDFPDYENVTLNRNML